MLSFSTATHDHETIYRLLTDPQRPHLIGRIAGIELRVAASLLEKGQTGDLTERDIRELENNAGIHITSSASLTRYATRLLEAYEASSFIAEWPVGGEVDRLTGSGQRFISRRTPTIPKGSALSLEPYYLPLAEQGSSWLRALEGKRVLVLHPFIHTFQQQIKYLRELYPGRSWLEGCTFSFIKPPLTLAGNHQGRDWEEHYQECLHLLRQAHQETPFDIALVGAGGYGMLLSHALVKECGISTVYVGGALQLFFGVIGKRWFTNPQVMRLMNDRWVRPMREDQPAEFKRVEGGCYW